MSMWQDLLHFSEIMTYLHGFHDCYFSPGTLKIKKTIKKINIHCGVGTMSMPNPLKSQRIAIQGESMYVSTHIIRSYPNRLKGGGGGGGGGVAYIDIWPTSA